MAHVSSSANKTRLYLIYSAAALASVLILLLAVLMFRPGTPGTSSSPRQTGSDQIGLPSNLRTGTAASQSLAAADPAPFVLPEGSGFELLGAQVPGKAERGVPILLSYSDGNKNVSITEILGGIESQFIPAGGDSADTSEPYSILEYPLRVRGGKAADYTEARSGSHTRSSIQWQEDGWLIVVEAEDVERDYMLKVVEALTQQPR